MEKSAKLLSKNDSILQSQYARRVVVAELKSISLDGTVPGESPEGTAWLLGDGIVNRCRRVGV